MSTYVNTTLPKICHARVGQKVRLPDTQTGEVQPEVFVVAAREQKGRRAGRSGMSNGLYDDQRELMLVSLNTGAIRPMPHLSSRAELLQADEAPVPEADVQVLVPMDCWHDVELAYAGGLKLAKSVNLADAKDVLALLDRMKHSGAGVVSVKKSTALRDDNKVLAEWRQFVVEGKTLLSFEEFKASLS
ncbi:hypothetical protein KTD31_00365 [Burkholderia multivorans]|uniref:hypothetical protein n=1 Tax=Burkholderia multivorans TaxID=87883 RepID=UPI001C23DA9D|nr:hypothetical protein [Burkholderia multivorans]MBU9199852.1 hypothetical protein [Burkholderia multivorans]MDN8079029.1 hypothetical protein [Burkholderia multivorans]